MIKEIFDSNKTFAFIIVSSDIISEEIVSLDTKKATHSNDVPTKSVKANADLFRFLYLMFFMNLSFLANFCVF